jgi:hypothetical protein
VAAEQQEILLFQYGVGEGFYGVTWSMWDLLIGYFFSHRSC